MSAHPSTTVSAAEQTTAARIGGVLFRQRGWLPVPFLLVPLVAPGQPTVRTTLVGVLLVLLGEAWRLWGIAAAGTVTRRRSREVQRLVTYGAFSWSRNPLYNGNFLLWMGFITISGVLWFVPVAAVLFAIEYSLIVAYEEGVLESTFGAEYLAYKARTPRWFPRGPQGEETGPHDWREAIRSERDTVLAYLVLGAVFWAKARYWR
ncbi:MAG: isoprenylcysteine carboxylmethyltransferase family protein [Gemmatimonadaceae bacterium]|nr:isoprenylcysteine carboxylmethyltransferase family protein [Gemmatimonadaceae bacterium]